MNLETTSFHNWKNSLKLSNPHVELTVTTDVGPRILDFRCIGLTNIFKTYEEQLGGQFEKEWLIRGGHRLWLAPEDEVLTYHIDNEPVNSRQDLATGEIVLESLQTHPRRLRKTLGITMGESHKVTIRHTITNEGSEILNAATWGLSVLRPGGLQIIPQPPLGEHPRDLLPNRGLVLWPYTDLSDPRITFGRKFWLLRQAEGYPPFKLGMAHRENWVAYVLDDCIFIKIIHFESGAVYPDGGCNYETFTNNEMIEIESLGALTDLKPGESVTHYEDWYLFPLTEEMHIETEEALADWAGTFLAQIEFNS